jgi:hypothetical protein
MRSPATAAVWLGLLVAGCPPEDDCKIPQPTLESLHAIVLEPSCALSGSCHNDSKDNPEPVFDGDRDDGSFDLTDPENLCDYIDLEAVTDREARPLITCGSCADSYLMIKVDPALEREVTSSEALLKAQRNIRATSMPQSKRGKAATPLCQPKIDVLCEWIDAGCPGCETD